MLPTQKGVFLCTGTRLAYAGRTPTPFFLLLWRMPKLKRLPTVLGSILTILFVFLQLKELKEAHHKALLNALKHPDANVQQLLKETEEKYKSK